MSDFSIAKSSDMRPTLSQLRQRIGALLGATVAAIALGIAAPAAQAQTTLLNVSYDVARELFKDINPAFIAEWKKNTGETLTINQSHGGSSKQARSVADGLEASVVTMNQANDIDFLADRGLVPADWAKRLPNNAAPFYSTMVYLVRKGNPKQIRTWEDLAKPGVKVVIPNPKVTGNGRYTYLAAWGSVIKKGGSEAQARDLVDKIFKNVPVLDGGGRAATTTFTQREIGDVLVTFENEVQLVRQEFGDNFEVVYPNISILAESPVSVVDKVVDRKGIRKQATAYLQYLYSEPAQEIIAKHYFRPRSANVAKKYEASFKPIQLFTVDEVFGGWKAAQKKHFDDGGEFDKIYQKK
ncbi:MAG: thiosulfate transporter subunit [Noviherbaspirillum sp.]|jgi:sulfate transport system substrate-binding protein|nr:thiosulfate transporter subunit [Noviherbaspirillum sp.]